MPVQFHSFFLHSLNSAHFSIKIILFFCLLTYYICPPCFVLSVNMSICYLFIQLFNWNKFYLVKNMLISDNLHFSKIALSSHLKSSLFSDYYFLGLHFALPDERANVCLSPVIYYPWPGFLREKRQIWFDHEQVSSGSYMSFIWF